MTTYEPGTVAVATVDGTPNVRIFIDAGEYNNITAASGAVYDKCDVTDVRPLVVLDVDALAAPYEPNPTNFASVTQLLRCLGSGLAEDIADQIEAQTKPPRIPEPGLWGVVEATYLSTPARTFVRTPDGWSSVTSPGRAGVECDWQRLVDPVLVRDGIEDGAS